MTRFCTPWLQLKGLFLLLCIMWHVVAMQMIQGAVFPQTACLKFEKMHWLQLKSFFSCYVPSLQEAGGLQLRCKPCLPVIHRLATGGGAAWLGATSKKSWEKSTLPGPAKKKVGMDGRVNGDDCAQVTDSHDCNARFLRLRSTPFHWSDCQLLFHCIDRYMNCCHLTAFNRRIKWALV